MDIIITHQNTDFDALACQIAASKLYPDAIRVVAGGLPPNVRRFVTMYRDHFDLTPVDEIDLANVTRVVVVDVRSRSRLRDFEPLWSRIDAGDNSLCVQIFDHHISSSDDFRGYDTQLEPVGACATLLVEQLRKNNIPLTPFEATAIALGIHADTGSLTYANTTVQDVEAVSYLMAQDANLLDLRYYLHPALSSSQLQLLIHLLSHSELVELNGLRISVCTMELERTLMGLSEVVGEALKLGGCEGVFGLFQKRKSVTVVGRSWHPNIDMGAILKQLGGGGHQGAGSAVMKNVTLIEAKRNLMTILNAHPPVPYQVRHLMTNPVFTVSCDQILDEIAKIFEAKAISGAPVMKLGKLVGILSKRDIRAAKRENRSHLPISSCMSQQVCVIDPKQPILRAIEKMTSNGVGRLPVVSEGELVGIITRNDIIDVMYHSRLDKNDFINQKDNTCR